MTVSWQFADTKIGDGGFAPLPVAKAVVFGLAFATILTLVIVPVMVKMIWSVRDPFAGKRPTLGVAAD